LPWKKEAKNIEKDALNEHKKLSALTEQNAKFRYVQKVRGLRTYGVSFFTAQVRIFLVIWQIQGSQFAIR
jgi:hypothetical protein